MRTLKFAFLLSSLAASATLFAQNTTPAQSPAAKAPAARPAEVAQAPAAGGQAAGAAAGQTSAGTGTCFVIPAAIAAGLVAVIAASDSDNGSTAATTHH